VEAGFLATETRRRTKGRPAKVYFTWESEVGGVGEAGVDVSGAVAAAQADELEVEVRVHERLLHDARAHPETIKQLLEAKKKGR
jgi:hypothetical protein